MQHFINLLLPQSGAALCTEPNYFIWSRAHTHTHKDNREISSPSIHKPLLMTINSTFSTHLRPPTFYSPFSVPLVWRVALASFTLDMFNDFSCHTGRQTKRVGEVGIIKALQSAFTPWQMQLDTSWWCERLAPHKFSLSIFQFTKKEKLPDTQHREFKCSTSDCFYCYKSITYNQLKWFSLPIKFNH